ncbi:class I SAM-dependent methyltransferase [Prauserella cavernicola]|uniref:Class I SAM-dependent methyltransferase n=1 Tax=Prauserella cavernicola TaxID=2800127 RepID=A0A934QMV5_9PSEU|nr:class I SAM-dependent methyltransferase [Prauserella cavernicola]MBK1784882.1 class I SAM-dependent methyltransferase [Prauserella cavernicola]
MSRRAYWDRQAADYDARRATAERRYFAESRPWVCGRAVGSTLELAVGTGLNLPHYPAEVELTGIEWSPSMLAEALRRAESLGRRIDLRVADATDLPFAPDSFDTVVSTFSLCCVSDHRRALAEAARVLRPGGRLLLADHVAASSVPVRVLQHLVDVVSIPAQGEHYTRRPIRRLAALGLDVVESQRTTYGAIERVHARKN